MPTHDQNPFRWPDVGLLAVLADRATRRCGDQFTDPGITAHLRVIVARVLRTGRGPEPLVGWVRHQLADHPPPTEDPADHLAVRLLSGLLTNSATDTRVGR